MANIIRNRFELFHVRELVSAQAIAESGYAYQHYAHQPEPVTLEGIVLGYTIPSQGVVCRKQKKDYIDEAH